MLANRLSSRTFYGVRAVNGYPVDSSSWLALLELASEVDGQPVVVANDLSAEEIERSRQDLSEQMGCLPMSLEAYQRLLWHLAFESRPELQANLSLTADQLRSPIWKDGRPVDLESLVARTQPLERRCNASISSHACRAIRDRAARSIGLDTARSSGPNLAGLTSLAPTEQKVPFDEPPIRPSRLSVRAPPSEFRQIASSKASPAHFRTQKTKIPHPTPANIGTIPRKGNPKNKRCPRQFLSPFSSRHLKNCMAIKSNRLTPRFLPLESTGGLCGTDSFYAEQGARVPGTL